MITSNSQLKLQVGGTVNARTGVYIVRPSDDELLQYLERGEYANVLCSRQMGKSSLLMRTKSRLEEKGYATAAVDIAGYLGTPIDANEWYRGLLDEITDQLHLKIDINDWWRNSRAITLNQRVREFFRDEVAVKANGPVVIFMDEIDSTLRLSYTDDFFVAIRSMYNDRVTEPLYDCITFCLAGVATPNELIKDRRTTPYNIGRTIELKDFDTAHDDLVPLFQAMSSDKAIGELIVRWVLRWTAGHPYLTIRLCDQLVAKDRISARQVDHIIKEQFGSPDQLYADAHFQQVLRYLDERAEDKTASLALYRQILGSKPVADQTTPAHLALKLAGIVKRDKHGNLVVRNPIYARVFTNEWAARASETSADSFNKMLKWLNPDRELAAEEYIRLQERLRRFFRQRGLPNYDELADETFNRIATRIEEGEIIDNLVSYCFGVARFLALQAGSKTRAEIPDQSESLLYRSASLEADKDIRTGCFQKCLAALSTDDRKLILEYYSFEEKIDKRRALAESMNVSMNVLRIRAFRLRQKLESCIGACMQKRDESLTQS